jgi:SAM-dependent methyltransferase
MSDTSSAASKSLAEMDLFAEALWRLFETGHSELQVERDDGRCEVEDISWYLTNYSAFPRYEKKALRFARGRVLDVGCGAGRHALYLQRRGFLVTGIDASPRLVELARERGVEDVRVVDACGRLPFRNGEFDTVILFGNNLGICGTPTKFKRMMSELYRITSSGGRLLATTRSPNTSNPLDLAYLSRNIKLGRAVGQVRLRLVHSGKRSAWFDLLLFAPTDLIRVAAKEGWKVLQLFTSDELEYSVVAEKSP